MLDNSLQIERDIWKSCFTKIKTFIRRTRRKNLETKTQNGLATVAKIEYCKPGMDMYKIKYGIVSQEILNE